MKERFWIYLLILGLTACVIVGFGPSADSIKKPDCEMIKLENDSLLRHVVLFKFKEGSSKEDVKALEIAFADLPSKIDAIQGFEWGVNNSPEGLDKGFTHCFFVSFKTESDRDRYLPHAAHQAFVKLATPHIDDVLVMDYWAK